MSCQQRLFFKYLSDTPLIKIIFQRSFLFFTYFLLQMVLSIQTVQKYWFEQLEKSIVSEIAFGSKSVPWDYCVLAFRNAKNPVCLISEQLKLQKLSILRRDENHSFILFFLFLFSNYLQLNEFPSNITHLFCGKPWMSLWRHPWVNTRKASTLA